MELNGWSSPQMLRRYGASARNVRAAGPTTARLPTRPDHRQHLQDSGNPAETSSIRPRRAGFRAYGALRSPTISFIVPARLDGQPGSGSSLGKLAHPHAC
jgi:hypothetical protein